MEDNMWKNFDTKTNVALKSYLSGPRKSWFYGVVSLPPIMALYVASTKLTNDIWTDVVLCVFILLSIALLSLVTFENRKWRSLPISILITMGYGICTVGTLASLTENTPDQVLNSTLIFMAIYGLYGFCGAIMGILIHSSFGRKKSKIEIS